MENNSSPYRNSAPNAWIEITKALIERHPLDSREIVDITLKCWDSIFDSRIGQGQIGTDIFPKPQIMGFFLHELIPIELAARHPGVWRGEKTSADKDIVFIPNDYYSIEVKTSSNSNQIFGNRSYAQETSTGKKAKEGYYLTVNFEPFSSSTSRPSIVRIRFGWIDSSDWVGQRAASGQQSRLSPDIYRGKFIQLYVK